MLPDVFDVRKLRVLVELAHRGTMREVAAATGYSTSAVSAQLAALERETGLELLEPAGRQVRFTPTGLRLVAHARAVLAAVDAARADLAGDGPVAGTVRVAAYASSLTADCLAVARRLRADHREVHLHLQEREPDEALALLADGAVDLAVLYDYDLAPHPRQPGVSVEHVCAVPIVLAVPARLDLPPPGAGPNLADLADLASLSGQPWVVNSRGRDDDELAARVCAPAGFTPRITHRADSLDVVQGIVAAGLGIALLPALAPERDGVRRLALPPPGAHRRMYLATRPGHLAWPPLALVSRLLAGHARAAATGTRPGSPG